MAESLRMVKARRIVTSLSAFGHGTIKPLELWTTLPEVDDLIKSLRASTDRLGTQKQCLSRVTPKSKARSKKDAGHSAKKGWSAKGWVTGDTKKLKESQEYPPDFVAALSSAVLRASRVLSPPAPASELD